jgi:HEAT repeat protein
VYLPWRATNHEAAVTTTEIPDNFGEPEKTDQIQDTGKNGTATEERLEYFIHMLTDDDEINRWKAAEALGRLGDPGAVEPLIDALWDDDSRVRLKAAWALGQVGDVRAVAPLKRLYRMEKEDMKESISEAIEEINRRISRE